MASRVSERGPWDAAVKALGGSVLQSWAWGEWYRRGGAKIERVRVDSSHGTGLAQLLIWPHGPVAYLPGDLFCQLMGWRGHCSSPSMRSANATIHLP
jgi:hypothetical protein